MPAFYLLLLNSYYANNFVGKIDTSLNLAIKYQWKVCLSLCPWRQFWQIWSHIAIMYVQKKYIEMFIAGLCMGLRYIVYSKDYAARLLLESDRDLKYALKFCIVHTF